jgi:Uma2 family endonuclease
MSDALRAYEEPWVTSYADYLEIEDRVEVIDGDVYGMASPVGPHQDVVGGLYGQLWLQLDGKSCHPYVAPFDVRLFYKADGSDRTVVQPDVMVICDRTKIDRGFCKGAPDFVIEVLSESTRRIDMIVKLNQYQRAGVKEYWIVDIESRAVMISLLQPDGFYTTKIVEAVGKVPIATLSGLSIDFDRVFAGIV